MLGKLHFYTGILIIVIFILTGQYMDHTYNHLKDMELMNRALFRAGHLYILLFGLVNLALGINLKQPSRQILRGIQIFGSILIFLATMMVIYSFFTELPTEQIERPMARNGLYLILGGVVIHGIIFLIKPSNQKQ